MYLKVITAVLKDARLKLDPVFGEKKSLARRFWPFEFALSLCRVFLSPLGRMWLARWYDATPP